MKKIIAIIVATVIVIGAAVTTIIVVNHKPSTGANTSESVQTSESTTDSVSDDFKQPQEDIDDFKKEIGGCSETYDGALSEKSYDNAEAAAKDYVGNEVIGLDKTCEISDVKTNDVELGKAASLGIKAELIEGATELKECTVTYTESQKEEAKLSSLSTAMQPKILLTAAAASENKTVKVYVVYFGDVYKYFAPAPKTGDTITKSYFDSIFNSSKYENCTMECSSSSKVSMVIPEEVMKQAPADALADMPNYSGSGDYERDFMVNKVTQLVKYSKDAIYVKQSVTQTDLMGNGGVKTTDSELYFIKNESNEFGYDLYVKTAFGWSRTSVAAFGYKSADQLRPFHSQYVDYSYFTKTDFGCSIEKENLELYMNELVKSLKELSKSMDTDTDIDISFKVKKGYLNYFVHEGVLSGMKSCFDSEVPIKAVGMTAYVRASAEGVTKCYDYGTTTIERPEGISA